MLVHAEDSVVVRFVTLGYLKEVRRAVIGARRRDRTKKICSANKGVLEICRIMLERFYSYLIRC
jgi:hypothetical protein